MKGRGWVYVATIAAMLVYSSATLISKGASGYEFMTNGYLWSFGGAIGALGIYAFLWQQIIKILPISDAYMFKGLSIIFVLLFSRIIFGEAITLYNFAGAILIVGGIALYSKS